MQVKNNIMRNKINRHYGNGLWIDTSCKRGVIALSIANNIISEIFIDKKFYCDKILYLNVKKCLEKTAFKLENINFICVCSGFYYSISARVGIAFAKGLSLGLNINLYFINTLKTLINSINISYMNGIGVIKYKNYQYCVIYFYKYRISNYVCFYHQIICTIDKLLFLCENFDFIVSYNIKCLKKHKHHIILHGVNSQGMIKTLFAK